MPTRTIRLKLPQDEADMLRIFALSLESFHVGHRSICTLGFL